jgi:hypothetical protein
MKIEGSTFVAAVRQLGKLTTQENVVLKNKNTSHTGKQNLKDTVFTDYLNRSGNHRANSRRCPVNEKQN